MKLAHTLLNTNHALLKQKQAAQSDAEEYAQCQKSLRAAQNLCNEKDSVIFLMEEQIGLLRDAMQTQGLDFPETPKSAPAPAPSSNSMAPPQSRNRVKSHFEDAVTDYRAADPVPGQHRGPESIDPGWGNIRRDNVPTPDLDHGWGSMTGNDPSPSPSSHGFSDSSNEPPRMRYGKNFFKKGKGKGGKYHNAPQSLASGGKRGREYYEEDQHNRDVRHKAWNSNGMSVANAWAKSICTEISKTECHTLTMKNGMKPLTMPSCFYTRILACQLGSMYPLIFITKLDNGYVITRLRHWKTPRCWTNLMAKANGELPSMLTRPPSPSQPIFRNWGKMTRHYVIIEL